MKGEGRLTIIAGVVVTNGEKRFLFAKELITEVSGEAKDCHKLTFSISWRFISKATREEKNSE